MCATKSHLSLNAVLLVAAAALMTACGPSNAPAGGPGAAKGGAPGGPGGPGGAMPAMPVALRTVALQTVPVLVDTVGQAEGSKEVEVRARVSGLVERQLFSEGERVRAGAPLFAIERAPFVNAVAQAQAALAQEQSKLEQSKREAARLKPLAEMQAIAQREADDANTNQRNAQANTAAAQARLRDAELNLSYTAINAPIAGVTGRAEKSQGSLVSAADGLLLRITQTDPIWVRFSFSESELAQLRAGQGASVKLLSADGKPMGAAGKLNFTGSVVDPRTGTVQLRAAFANPELTVLPGQFVKAQVQTGQQRAFLVPQAAVGSGERGKTVWTVQDGKATPVPVEVGGWVGADWVVYKGLKEGDQVIIDNLLKLRPGAPVQAASPSPPPAAASAASAPR
jgi:membrane fusion protein, multidrug efflux system